ncbi:hypothetical protein WN943_006151 [Citrus x changshan-huyou]
MNRLSSIQNEIPANDLLRFYIDYVWEWLYPLDLAMVGSGMKVKDGYEDEQKQTDLLRLSVTIEERNLPQILGKIR